MLFPGQIYAYVLSLVILYFVVVGVLHLAFGEIFCVYIPEMKNCYIVILQRKVWFELLGECFLVLCVITKT
jgi:hypothetical protein